MSEPRQGRYDDIARRWLALVERRQQHFIELSKTGRWRHYYTQAEFLDEMRKVLRVRDQWAAIAGELPHDAVAANGQVVSLSELGQSRRDRAERQPAANSAGATTAATHPD